MTTPRSPDSEAPDEISVDTTRQQQPDDAKTAAKMPHERDQSVGATRDEPHPEIAQAHEDVKRGLVDTDARGKDGRPVGTKQPTP